MTVAEKQITEKIKVLLPRERDEVLQYVEDILSKRTRKMTLGEKLSALSAEVSEDVWEEIPNDGSKQHDHYIYGTPKK